MPGHHATASAVHDDGTTTDADNQAALGPFIDCHRSLRLRRRATAFTDGALLREVVSCLQRARRASHERTQRAETSEPGVAATSLRWCGASPLARKHAKWRERLRTKAKAAQAMFGARP